MSRLNYSIGSILFKFFRMHSAWAIGLLIYIQTLLFLDAINLRMKASQRVIGFSEP
jgi:hypothetical protein